MSEKGIYLRDFDLEKASLAEVRSNLARPFYGQALDELDQSIHGEMHAKEVGVAAMVMGAENANVTVGYGIPGTGKTMLLKQLPKLVDYPAGVIGRVPARADLSPAELVGKIGRTIIKTESEGKITTQIITKEVDPIIKQGIDVLVFDEVNRIGPTALNAALEILQDGHVTVYDNEGNPRALSAFDLVFMAMNDDGTRFTNPLDPAVSSRLANGFSTGEKANDGDLMTPAGVAVAKGFSERARDVIPLISTHNLRGLRKFIVQQPLTSNMEDLLIAYGSKEIEFLMDNGLNAGDPRLASQVRRMAQTRSILQNHETVTEEDIRFAVVSNLIAKAGPIQALVDSEGKRIKIRDLETQVLG